MNLTPWIPGTVKPVRVGVYLRNVWGEGEVTYFSYWNGKHWCAFAPTPELAANENHTRLRSSTQTVPWRGVAK